MNAPQPSASTTWALVIGSAVAAAAVGTAIIYAVNQWAWQLFDQQPWQDVVSYLAFVFVVLLIAMAASSFVCRNKGAPCRWHMVVMFAVVTALVLTLPPLMFGFQSARIKSWTNNTGGTFSIGDAALEVVAMFFTFLVVLVPLMALVCYIEEPTKAARALYAGYASMTTPVAPVA